MQNLDEGERREGNGVPEGVFVNTKTHFSLGKCFFLLVSFYPFFSYFSFRLSILISHW